jgi:GGDEF domain-containing protein
MEKAGPGMNDSPYQALVDLLSNVLEAYTTAFFVYDPKARQLELVASQSLSRSIRDTVSLPLEQSGILSQVQKVGQTIHLDNLQEASLALPTTVPFYREGESHIKGIYAMPVGDGIGVLYVDTKYGWGFTDKQRKWIREVAAVINQLLLRQKCLVQQQSFAGILEFWYKVDEIIGGGHTAIESCKRFVSECAQLLDMEYGFIALRESGQPHYHLLAGTFNTPPSLIEQRFLLKQGLAGWVFQQGKPLSISKLNPHTPDHFLFTPAEGLPHHGALWALPVQMSLGHTLLMILLSRTAQELDAEYQRAISCVLHFFALRLDQVSLKEECEQLRTFDLSTGIYNASVFASKMEELLATSMQNSSPFALALMQFEPWHTLHTAISPKQIQRCQQELAYSLRTLAPSDSFLGLISENRFGFLFPQMSFQEANPILTHLMDRGKQVLGNAFKGIRVRSYLGVAGYPQDSTRIEELWPLVYRRLYRGIHARVNGAQS